MACKEVRRSVAGWSGFFKLEGAINTASGQIANNGRSVLNNANDLSTISSASSINGQAFSRAQYVGIAYPLLGPSGWDEPSRSPTEQVSEFDPLHASGLYSPIGYSGTIGGGLGITEMVGSTTASGTTTRLAASASAFNTRSSTDSSEAPTSVLPSRE